MGLYTLVLLQIPIADIWVLVPPHGNSLGWSAKLCQYSFVLHKKTVGETGLETTHVLKLRLEVSKGMLSIKILLQKCTVQ